jgi:hypothetical protein
LEDVAVHAPQAALAVTVKVAGTSGLTPQFGSELSGHVSTVDVPVGGRLVDAGVKTKEHEVLLKFAVTLRGPFMKKDWGFVLPPRNPAQPLNS